MMDIATAIKEQVSCREFAESIGLKINRAGFAVCPFHGDTDASLKIYKGDKGWCCFGCHRGGDVINMASLYYGLPFRDTLQRLNDDFQLGLIDREAPPEQAAKRAITAVEIAKRKAARAKEARLEAALEAAYWTAFDKWLANERIIRDKAPQTPDEEFNQDFVRALVNRDAIRDELETIELRRMHYEPN